jgi:hypothetical protein
MATENADLESKIRRENHIIYAGLATLFAAGSAACAIGTQYQPDHSITLYGTSAYSALLSAGTIFWWYKATRP